MYKYLTFFLSLIFSSVAMAQRPGIEMADELRANGKIYVVVVIIALIFAGIITYLIHIDRKVSKLEKNKAQ